MPTRKVWTALGLAAVLTGCAAPTTQGAAVSDSQNDAEAQRQMDLVAQDLIVMRARLQAVYWRLATSAAQMCPRKSRLLGMDAISGAKGDLAAALQRVAGVGHEMTVISVVPGGAADVAGVKARDVLLTAWEVPFNSESRNTISEHLRNSEAQWDQVPLRLRRAGQTMQLTVKPPMACDYPTSVTDANVLNAVADGENIFVTKGMMNFVHTEDELALVVSHEMGHNVMRHAEAKRKNSTLGMLGDIALAIASRGNYSGSSFAQLAAQTYTKEFEAEADYVGLYILANAGYAYAEAPKFWRRMAVAAPANIRGSAGSTHPSTAYRMVALEATAKEIDAKKAASQPLVPNLKDGQPFGPAGKDAPKP